MNKEIKIDSEISRIGSVIVHRPDRGIEFVTPNNKTNLLYDDIVFLEQMQQEHDLFVGLLNAVVGSNNVVDVETMLADILEIDKIKQELILTVCQFEQCWPHEETLSQLCARRLATTLITGSAGTNGQLIFQPIPNYIFCRDIATVINNSIIVGQAAKKARARESILSRYIFRHHKYFKTRKELIELSSIDELKNAYRDGENHLAFEGGDVMMFGPHVLIGCSERTSTAAFDMVKDIILNNKLAESVIQINIPKERFCMHLDTIFAVVDYQDCVAFSPLVMTDILKVTQYSGTSVSRSFSSVKDLLNQISPGMNFIPCGNGIAPHDEREQWTDACNVLTLKPGIAIMYDRNVNTLKGFRQHGYDIVEAADFLSALSGNSTNFDSISKTIITIPSNELSRARGGPHCLSLPLSRF